LTGQDIGGPTTFRVAATHPELDRSYADVTAVSLDDIGHYPAMEARD
jgi:hypothetical protein